MVTLNPFTIVDNIKDAKKARETAKFTIDYADGNVYEAKEEARQNLRRLGKLKMRCFDSTIPALLEALQLVDYEPGKNYTLGPNKSVSFPVLKMTPELSAQCAMASTLASSSASGIAGGGLTAYAIYYGVGVLGAKASTGIAISSLSGMAAQNATLAWLGGGTLANGGAGILGGLSLLGIVGIAAGLTITGIQLGAKSQKAKYEAEKEMWKAFEYEDAQKIVFTKLKQLAKVVQFSRELLKKLDELAKAEIDVIKENIQKFGTNFENMPEQAQYSFYRGTVYLDLLDSFSQVKIMDGQGKLIEDAEDNFNELSHKLSEM